jgi:hypothetical protein
MLAVTPVPVALRVDPEAAAERAWLLVAATVGALVQIADPPVPATAEDLLLEAGDHDGHLALRLRASAEEDAELAVVAFDEQVEPIARLRARALAVPARLLEGAITDLRAPGTPSLRSIEAIARLGGRPADDVSVADHEEAALALLEPIGAIVRPHDDPDPARRVARRILQRLHGMGKWGGYHTDFAHLARGFRGNERALAEDVGERLIEAGLLSEKPSVGQRHVFLNPRRAADIHALIERGELPPGLRLPSARAG